MQVLTYRLSISIYRRSSEYIVGSIRYRIHANEPRCPLKASDQAILTSSTIHVQTQLCSAGRLMPVWRGA